MNTIGKTGLAAVLFLAASTPTLAGDLAGHKFLVTSVRTGDTEVFLVDPTTGDATNLSRSPKSEDRYPCWSPDGKRVAFISDRAGGANLFVMNADGGNVKQLTHTTAICYMPSWVGDRIVLGMHGLRPEMATIRDDGTDLRMLGEGHDPCLSPDGKKIVYTGQASGGVTVFVMDADGGNKRQLVKESNSWGAVFPSWSPDGKQIVYSFKAGEALELFLVAADGSNLRQLTHLGKVATPAAWSPDGQWISFRLTDERYWSKPERMKKIYGEKPGDKRPVWVIHPDGSKAHVIESLRYQCAMDGSRAAWMPLGSALLRGTVAAEPPIHLHPENQHYFLFRGRPTVLVGSTEHYGAVLNRDFDYVRYLDELHHQGLNLTRTFSGVYCEDQRSFGIHGNTLAPAAGRLIAPWARSANVGLRQRRQPLRSIEMGPGLLRSLQGFRGPGRQARNRCRTGPLLPILRGFDVEAQSDERRQQCQRHRPLSTHRGLHDQAPRDVGPP